jgi:hypothetical protein
MRKTVAVVCWMSLATLMWLSHARAACTSTSLARSLSSDEVAAIFVGKVIEVQPVQLRVDGALNRGQTAKLRVERVWKGLVKRDAILHFGFGEGADGLDVGAAYLFIAHRLSAAGRAQFGLPAYGDSLGTNELGCGAIPFPGRYASEVLGDTPGRPPLQE